MFYSTAGRLQSTAIYYVSKQLKERHSQALCKKEMFEKTGKLSTLA